MIALEQVNLCNGMSGKDGVVGWLASEMSGWMSAVHYQTQSHVCLRTCITCARCTSCGGLVKTLRACIRSGNLDFGVHATMEQDTEMPLLSALTLTYDWVINMAVRPLYR